MLRASPRTVGTDLSDGLSRGAILSAFIHGAVLIGLTHDFSFLTPDPDWEPIEVELLFVEPERKELPVEDEVRNNSPPEEEMAPVDEPEREPRTTTLPRQEIAAEDQSSRPRTSDSWRR